MQNNILSESIFKLSKLCKIKMQETKSRILHFGGFERIRTAVDGVADHCLATRPRNPVFKELQI